LNLDLENNLFKDLKEKKFVKDFIKELSGYLENNLFGKNEEIPIIEKILKENNLTTESENLIRLNENDIIKKYAQEANFNETMYFVKDNKKVYWINNEKYYNNDIYKVLKVENNKIEEIEIRKKDIPQNINVNDVFLIKNDKYVLDNIATKRLQDEITNMCKEIINKQNLELDTYRKENHLYLVTQEVGNKRFLADLTEQSKNEFEEINISQDLLEKAKQGIILKYTNGIYEYYSDDGFKE